MHHCLADRQAENVGAIASVLGTLHDTLGLLLATLISEESEQRLLSR